jgi:hypothetical protein
MKTGVRIVECIDKEDDPGSEGRFLLEALRLMEVDVELLRVKKIEDLFEKISTSEMKFVHIATHGVITDTKNFRGWWTHRGIGNKQTVKQIKPKAQCKAIVSTACKSGVSEFANYVVNTMGSSYYIAPTGSPSWHNAAFFTHIYYYKLFQAKGTVEKAFKSYQESFRNPHKFQIFKRNQN